MTTPDATGTGVRNTTRTSGGFVATEFVAGVALLLVPVLMLVAALPTWVERRHAATVAAREAARAATETFPADAARGRAVAEVVAANYGIDPDDVTVEVDSADVRGGQVVARVTVALPALAVPFGGGVGQWHLTTTYALRVDDYRSRT